MKAWKSVGILLGIGVFVALLLGSSHPGIFSSKEAQAGVATLSLESATSATWSSAIVIQNNGTAPASVLVNFYSTTGVLIKSHALPAQISPKGSASVNLDDILDLPNGFLGSAVVSSAQPVSATVVLFDGTNASIDRSIYTGFAAGSNVAYVPALSNSYADQTSILAVQNLESSPINVAIKFYERFTGALTVTLSDSIPAYASHYYDAGNLTGGQVLPPPWSGAALVEASGKIVTAVQQPYISTNKAGSFEGTSFAGTEVYLPSALFQYASQKQTTYTAVQNTQAAPVNATLTYYDRAGAAVGSVSGTIEGYRKQSWNPGSAGIAPGFIGSAIVRASGPVVAMVNIGSVTDLAMSYTGLPAGSSKVAFPYVRWAPQGDAKGWRTYIAVMNVDQASPADVILRYYDTNGALVNTAVLSNIAPNTKANHTPGLFVGDAPFAGTVEVEATKAVVGLVNAITVDGTSSASYTGLPIP